MSNEYEKTITTTINDLIGFSIKMHDVLSIFDANGIDPKDPRFSPVLLCEIIDYFEYPGRSIKVN